MGQEDLVLLCRLAKSMLESMPPRSYDSKSFTEPCLMFTDGAWESDQATAGAVVYDPDAEQTSVFEVIVPSDLVELLATGRW